MATYSLGDAARILKVKPSRLRYWNRTRLVPRKAEPQIAPEGFDFGDLVCLKAILGLLEQGVSLQRIRTSIDALRERVPEMEDPTKRLRLWVEGSRRVVVDHDGVLLEPDGQLMLDFRPLEADAQLLEAALADDADADAASRSASALKWFEEGCLLDSDPETYEQAMQMYRKGIEADPSFADLHCNLGAVHYNRGERQEARRCFERCLELCPDHVEAHFNLANVLEEEGCDDMALRHYRAALQADPFCADLHVNLSLLYEKLGHPKRGREHWRRYLQLEPEGAWSDVARMRLEE